MKKRTKTRVTEPVAPKLADWFIKIEARPEAYTLRDDRPQWLLDAVYAAHDDKSPDDWVYAQCREACIAIDEGKFVGEEWQDELFSFAEAQVDIYTVDRFQWAAKFCLSGLFASAEEEARDAGLMEGADVAKTLGILQHYVIERITSTIVEAVRKNR